MPLREFQTAFGRMVRNPNDVEPLRSDRLNARERECLMALQPTEGFRFTRAVQRSWCESRAAKAAYLTLSALSEDVRQRVLDEWTGAGGGTSSFFGTEAEGLLEFIARRVPDPSPELEICRFEQAVIRASVQSSVFRPPPFALFHATRVIRCSWHARVANTLLIAPGLASLHRVASEQEQLLWSRLAEPAEIGALLQEGYAQDLIEALLHLGALEYGC